MKILLPITGAMELGRGFEKMAKQARMTDLLEWPFKYSMLL